MAEHLTIDEILDFVTMDNIDENTLSLIARVNSHILVCKECFELVNAIQLIQEEFERLQTSSDFRSFVSERYSNGRVSSSELQDPLF
ncbi:MAG: hypothetical protein IJO68_03255 [Clostridia bacterium]|nr:hypothetical protein [Clostridia bacterium]